MLADEKTIKAIENAANRLDTESSDVQRAAFRVITHVTLALRFGQGYWLGSIAEAFDKAMLETDNSNQ